VRALLSAAVLGAIALGSFAACKAPQPAAQGPVASPGPAGPPGSLQGAPGAQTRVPREYLVTVRPGAGEGAVREVYGELGIARIDPIGNDVYLVVFGEDPGLERLEARREQDPRIRAVQPNYVYRAM
jgi:hypothetical protein